MKRTRILLFLIMTLALICTGCSSEKERKEREEWRNAGYNTGYEEGWGEGFSDGYDTGLVWGAFEAQEDLASQVRSAYSDKEWQTAEKCGWHPEEALMVLNDYINGEQVSAEDLHSAIESLNYFYYEAWEVVADIDEMDIDIDFD